MSGTTDGTPALPAVALVATSGAFGWQYPTGLAGAAAVLVEPTPDLVLSAALAAVLAGLLGSDRRWMAGLAGALGAGLAVGAGGFVVLSSTGHVGHVAGPGAYLAVAGGVAVTVRGFRAVRSDALPGGRDALLEAGGVGVGVFLASLPFSLAVRATADTTPGEVFGALDAAVLVGGLALPAGLAGLVLLGLASEERAGRFGAVLATGALLAWTVPRDLAFEAPALDLAVSGLAALALVTVGLVRSRTTV